MPKPRSDSKLKSLPSHQKDTLIRWLTEENLGYAEAKERLYQDFGVRTSMGALSQFYATECFTLRYSQAREIAETVGEQMAASPEKFDEATIALIKQKAFERAVAKGGDIDELSVLFKMLGDSAKLELKAREVAVSERRVELMQFDAAKAALQHARELRLIATDSKLSEADKLERARQRLFGVAPAGVRPIGETHGKGGAREEA